MRAASWRAVTVCGAAAASIFCAVAIVACTHDFGQFENGPESVSEGGVDSGPDGACNPDVACTNNAKSCGTQCKTSESQCETQCGGGGGGSGRCHANCQDAGAECNDGCVGYCVQCAGCNARTACESAL